MELLSPLHHHGRGGGKLIIAGLSCHPTSPACGRTSAADAKAMSNSESPMIVSSISLAANARRLFGV
jgi:hypothetical protein